MLYEVITILDSKTLGQDINFEELNKEGNVVSFETTTPEQTKERIKDTEIIITNKVIIGAEEMDSTPNLKLIRNNFV